MHLRFFFIELPLTLSKPSRVVENASETYWYLSCGPFRDLRFDAPPAGRRGHMACPRGSARASHEAGRKRTWDNGLRGV